MPSMLINPISRLATANSYDYIAGEKKATRSSHQGAVGRKANSTSWVLLSDCRELTFQY